MSSVEEESKKKEKSQNSTEGAAGVNADDAASAVDSGYAESAITDGQSIDLRPDVFAANGRFEGDAVTAPGSSSFQGHSHRRSPSLATRRVVDAQMSQMHYNRNRVQLSRAITAAVRLLSDLQAFNRRNPVYYPSPEDKKGKGKERAVEEEEENDDGNNESARPDATPRLVTQLQVFKLDLKMSGSGDAHELVKSLEKNSVAQLLEGKIVQTVRHLTSLRERIEDTASKVLITGDLNAGKSTFCNALLRRHLLPEDQQPCTAVFCEVKDYRENDNIEEVHAVLADKKYDREDLSTYEVFGLDKLDELVYEYEKYSLLKVFVHEPRPSDESLLNNGIVDISLIDAPGLNLDSYQTTQVFSRQEEIDLVVFVVSAENHFTQSAKEFISTVVHEKSMIFIVVNRFDTIRDKGRCQRQILGQVATLSPETHKDARDFVHFVSSRGVMDGLPGGGGGDGGGDGGGGGGGGDGDDAGPSDPDFDRLEESLRNFVLEKRSLSKLAPAKTYLLNILQDISLLADANKKFSELERERYLAELDEMTPNFEKQLSESVRVSEQIDKDIEGVVDEVYDHTTKFLNDVVSKSGDLAMVPYGSLFDSYNYAIRTKAAIIDRIQEAVDVCEDFARTRTSTAVNSIKSLGILHLGDKPAFMKVFRSEAMFSRKRDQLSRAITAEIGFWDFVDTDLLSVAWIPPTAVSQPNEKSVTTVNNALTLASVVGGGQLIFNSNSWLRQTLGFLEYSTVRRLVVPALAAAAVAGVAYMLMEIPNVVPRNVARKIELELASLGYVHQNADRISRECRKVLKYPAQDVRSAFQSNIEKQARQREECTAQAHSAETALTYFSQLSKESLDLRNQVAACDLTQTTVD